MIRRKQAANDNKVIAASYVPAPLFLPAFPHATRVRGKTILVAASCANAGRTAPGRSTNGTINMGARTKPPIPNYQVEP
jgi:hypothetical protein